MKLQELIDSLEKKVADFGKDAEVEGIVCSAESGVLLVADVQTQAAAMKRALKLFSQ